MKEKILNFFGLTTLKEQAKTVNFLIKKEEEIVKDCEVKINNVDSKLIDYKNLFDWKLFEKTLITWTDWCAKNNIENIFNWTDKIFYRYYNETRTCEYQAFKIRTISQYPKFLNAFLLELSNYDFNKDAEFFKEIGFKYPKAEEMSVDVLIDTVITLLPSNFDGITEKIHGWSSGGYEVCFYYENTEDELKPKCKIKFDKQLFCS